MSDPITKDDLRAFANLLRHNVVDVATSVQAKGKFDMADLDAIVRFGSAAAALDDVADRAADLHLE